MSNIENITSKPIRFDLTEEQAAALERIGDWLEKSKLATSINALRGAKAEFRLGGYAGTGKTTLIKEVIRQLNLNAAVCAFTGKAAFVLRQKGIKATTIHSLIYEPTQDAITGEVKWKLRESWDLQCDIIVVDEASMVSFQLYADLQKFNKPILFVGDPGQLEPIGDNPNLMKTPDFTLTQIQRQALESPIIGLATAVRTGGPGYDPRKFGSHGDAVRFMSKALTAEALYGADQVITARNLTRVHVNNKFRKDKGYGLWDGVHEGEKLICLKNDSTLGVFNGQVMLIHEVRDERPLWFETVVEFEGIPGKHSLNIWSEPFYREINERERPPREVAKCDFGYCITCHKAQGSEWDRVLVVDEFMGRNMDMARWRYTAITRAAKRLDYAI